MSGKTARLATAAALAALLAVSSVPARAEGPDRVSTREAGVLQQIWSWLSGILMDGEGDSLEHGCAVDPNGCPDDEG